jgi:hypothetical protein
MHNQPKKFNNLARKICIQIGEFISYFPTLLGSTSRVNVMILIEDHYLSASPTGEMRVLEYFKILVIMKNTYRHVC